MARACLSCACAFLLLAFSACGDDPPPDPDTHIDQDAAPDAPAGDGPVGDGPVGDGPAGDTTAGDGPTGDLPPPHAISGPWFIMFEVEDPIIVDYQVQSFVDVIVEGDKVTMQFVDADRKPEHLADQCNPACNFLLPCCRTLGVAQPTCVLCIEGADDPDEFPDFVPFPDGPPAEGYTFLVQGYVSGSSEPYTLNTLPFDLTATTGGTTVVVTGGELNDLTITTDGGSGRLKMTGTFSATHVNAGVLGNGPGTGTVVGLQMEPGEWPTGAPPNTTPPSAVTWP